ncbi:MAG TPA: TlpA family protein disulfide reductase [Flavitalea sp.]|nr:TlpA family protein disulfide reductase [Flavitalea sp.]
MKSAIYFLFICLVLSACSGEETNKFTVSGKMANLETIFTQYAGAFEKDSIKLFLYEVPFGGDGQPVQLDSTFVSVAKPTFELSGKTNGVGIYDVMIEKGPLIPMVNDVPAIKLDIDLLNKSGYYNISGSVPSQQIRDFVFSYSEKTVNTNNAFNRLDSLKLTRAADSVILNATAQKNQSLGVLNNYVKTFLSGVDNPSVAAFVLGTAASSLPIEEYDALLTKLMQKYPTDENLGYLKTQLEAKKNTTASSDNLWVGKQAPDLSLPDANGKMISLSSFRGKYVLVDFWASWCGPCRMENPNVVKAFNEYKDRNFTILGVSLDKERQPWLDAIKKDQLTWSHISDLAFWNSKAVEIFHFNGIPYNILVDPSGKVIGESLRGTQLTETLKAVLK